MHLLHKTARVLSCACAVLCVCCFVCGLRPRFENAIHKSNAQRMQTSLDCPSFGKSRDQCLGILG